MNLLGESLIAEDIPFRALLRVINSNAWKLIVNFANNLP